MTVISPDVIPRQDYAQAFSDKVSQPESLLADAGFLTEGLSVCSSPPEADLFDLSTVPPVEPAWASDDLGADISIIAVMRMAVQTAQHSFGICFSPAFPARGADSIYDLAKAH
jgi:hypothetical protein